MPERTVSTSKIQPQPPAPKPCGKQRDPLDVVGRVNDLMNCYLQAAGDYLRVYIPLAILAMLLFVVMVFAAYQFIKE